MAKRRALLIAVDKYTDKSIPDLKSPVRDAKKLAKALKHPRCGSFEVETLSAKASLEDVQIAIEKFLTQTDPNDLALLYFSGHGKTDHYGDFNFLLKNTQLAYLSSTSLTGETVKDAIRKWGSDRHITILDCCQAGAFNQPGMKGVGELKSVKVDPVGYGKYTLTAAGAESAAWEDEGTSLFSKYLIEALTFTGAAHEKPRMTPPDLHEYIGQGLRTLNKHIPPLEGSKLEADIVIAENEKASTPAALAAIPVPDAGPTAPAPISTGHIWRDRLLIASSVLLGAVVIWQMLSKDSAPEIEWSNAKSHVDYAGYNLEHRYKSPALLDGTRTTGRPMPWVANDFRTCADPGQCVDQERDVRLELFPSIWSPFAEAAFPVTTLPLLCVQPRKTAGLNVFEFALSHPVTHSEIVSVGNANDICGRDAGRSYVWYRHPSSGGSLRMAGLTLGDGQLTSYLSEPSKIFRVSLNPEHAFWVNWAEPK